MPQVKISEHAQGDLKRLYLFLAEKDEGAALRAIETIDGAFAPLRRVPEIGRPVDDDLRELVIEFGSSGYIALYHFDAIRDLVVILAIKHQLEDDYGLSPKA
jgi:plasmid stabilization system protein ParE